ncbi:MAG TPA: PilZ domain-containing protein [Thermoanaerobaculia bacterium]|nr:PilZ domain-containing protein [Thermoanaerobaculia bacterium]
MSRRRAVRRPRRVQVNFWRRGEPATYVGYTTNISMTGMFVATNSPMAGGTRIRIEVVDRDRGFMIEGVVAHARKIRGEMARISQSGMGVRFLSVEELMRELIPAALGQTEPVPQASSPPDSVSDLEMPDLPPSLESPPFGPFPEPVWPGTPPPPPPSPAPPPPVQAAPTPAPPPFSPRPAPKPVGEGTFSVRFASAEEFLEVYRRDILQGGLFVSTLHPARIQESVTVELLPPLDSAEPILLRARVVQRFEPHSSEAGGLNLLSGMGLELLDLPALVEQLQPIVQRLR